MSKIQYAITAALGALIVLGGLFLVLTPTPTVAPSKTETKEQTIQPTYKNASANDIVVTLPYPGAVTGKSFAVIGKARGPWFFEGSFPIIVLDKNGTEIATGLASPVGDGEWMTTELVDFKADIQVPEAYIGPATLVIKNDNPSGEPDKDKSISFRFTIEY